jgi:HK97 family phage major capsid protein
MNIKKLRQAKADQLAKAKGLAKPSEDANRAMTAEERTSFDAAMAQVKDLNEDIARAEALLDEERTVPAAQTAAGSGARADLPNEAKKPFANIGEQLIAVANAAKNPGRTPDSRLLAIEEQSRMKAAASGLSEGVPSDGGFLVQNDFSTALLAKSYETGILARKTTRLPLSENSNGMKLPAVDETSRANGSRFGGVQVFWAAEADAATAKKPKFRRMELELKKLIGLCYATDELVADAATLSAVIDKAFPEEFGFILDDVILRGTGAGQPFGIFNSGSLVAVAAEGGQAAATVVAANITKMFARVPARLLGGAEWYLNQDVLPQLPLMVIGQQPVYMPPQGLAGSPYGTLFGRPINVIEQAETLGTQGDIMLANLGEYVMIDKGALQSAVSMHVRFLNDENTFRWTYRVDGQPGMGCAADALQGREHSLTVRRSRRSIVAGSNQGLARAGPC